MLAYLLKELFTLPFDQYTPHSYQSLHGGDAVMLVLQSKVMPMWGDGVVAIPRRRKFSGSIPRSNRPWAIKDGNPQKRIAALELLGTWLLCKHLIAQQGTTLGRVRRPV